MKCQGIFTIMLFPLIRTLQCKLQKLFDNNEPNKELKYFNPSSAFPYLYVRATKKEEITEINHMFIYNYNTDIIQQIEIPYNMLSPTCAVYQGIEDARIVFFQNRLWFLASSTHISGSMQSEMLIGYFDPEVEKIEHIQFLDLGDRPVKNICPFVYQNKIQIIDVYNLKIYEIDNENGMYNAKLVKVLKPCSGLSLHTMRGSTSPIHLHGNIWGCVVHQHIRKADARNALSYVSFWMEFDIECCIVTFLSSPFYVAYWGVEFISGIEYYKDRDEIELYLGVQDKIAIVAYTSLYNLRYG